MKLPPLIYVKIDKDGSLGRAYLPDQINWRSEPPPGVQYIPFERNGFHKIFDENHKRKKFPIRRSPLTEGIYKAAGWGNPYCTKCGETLKRKAELGGSFSYCPNNQCRALR